MQSWESTQLCIRLVEKEAGTSQVLRVIGGLLKPAKDILASGGTTPLTFTLHDAEHGRRVAKRMWELLPDDVQKEIDSFELALLLSAAYLHDIGMCPDYELVRAYDELLKKGSSTKISERDRQRLLWFIDSYYPGRELPLTDDDLRSEILAYWCRDEHNDWSERWIRESAPVEELYPGWIEDLIRLCRSHHQGLAELRGASFNARQIGTPVQVVNLRYLAALLRVADVLELDPERTPHVILRHRHINSKSQPYWEKDHHITLTLEHERSQIRFSARPPSAVLYKAVLETHQQIDAELETCATLHDEGAFGLGSVPEIRRFHHWPWGRKLVTDIREGGDFVFINAAFRPHPKRVLELLAGAALYDNPFVAVRELLQNAIDAVHEQIAYEYLADPDCRRDENYFQDLRRRHKIWLRLEQSGDGRAWLTCRDSGCGMTRNIIEESLLVAGSPKRPDVRVLQRRCNAAGFELTRIGKFGIGCLSYFMLAGQVEIHTRRSEAASGNSGQSGWRFVIRGLDDFGELHPDPRAQPGTEVRLRLKEEGEDSPLVGGLAAFTDKLLAYIRETLIWLPCRFELTGADGTCYKRLEQPGWVRTVADLDQLASTLVACDFGHSENEMRPRALNCLRWFGPITGEERLLGFRYRVFLPYFNIDAQASILFFTLYENKSSGWLSSMSMDAEEFHDNFARFSCKPALAANGISVVEPKPTLTEIFGTRAGSPLIELDFTNAEIVELSRRRAELGEDLDEIRAVVRAGIAQAEHEFLEAHATSRWALINAASLDMFRLEAPLSDVDQKMVPYVFPSIWRECIEFKPCRFPLLRSIEGPIGDQTKKHPEEDSRYEIGGQCVRATVHLKGNICAADLLGGGRLALVRRSVHNVIAARVWLRGDEIRPGTDARLLRFPPALADLLLVGSNRFRPDKDAPLNYYWMNADHPLVLHSDPSLEPWAECWARQCGYAVADLKKVDQAALLSSSAHACAGLLALSAGACAEAASRGAVESTKTWETALLAQAFALALGPEAPRYARRLLIWRNSRTYIVSPEGLSQPERSPVRGDGLYFPDRTVLPWPTEPDWWVKAIQ